MYVQQRAMQLNQEQAVMICSPDAPDHHQWSEPTPDENGDVWYECSTCGVRVGFAAQSGDVAVPIN